MRTSLARERWTVALVISRRIALENRRHRRQSRAPPARTVCEENWLAFDYPHERATVPQTTHRVFEPLTGRARVAASPIGRTSFGSVVRLTRSQNSVRTSTHVQTDDIRSPLQSGKCQGGELNSRPRAYESPALPLSYPGERARKIAAPEASFKRRVQPMVPVLRPVKTPRMHERSAARGQRECDRAAVSAKCLLEQSPDEIPLRAVLPRSCSAPPSPAERALACRTRGRRQPRQP